MTATRQLPGRVSDAVGRRWIRGFRLVIETGAILRDALRALDAGAEAIVFVCEPETRRVVGAITDGDLRRALLRNADLDSTPVTEVMQRNFSSVSVTAGHAEVLDLMRARRIGQLPILDTEGRLCGLHTIGRMVTSRPRTNAAILLAGGRGTRLAPLTNLVPKPMVTVAGRPILERLLLHLMSAGIYRFYFSVNFLSHMIEEHFGDGSRFGCRITYLHESEPLGTGGPLSLLTPVPDEPVLVLNGDLVTQCDVGSMIDFHDRGRFVATMGLRHYSVEVPFGAATVSGDRLIALQGSSSIVNSSTPESMYSRPRRFGWCRTAKRFQSRRFSIRALRWTVLLELT